jgi:hypothetical protein
MNWPQLFALFGGGTGVGFLVRQLFGFTKFILKRKAVVDVRKMPRATQGEVLAMAEAMCMVDPNHRCRARGDFAGVTTMPSAPVGSRLLPDNEPRDGR